MIIMVPICCYADKEMLSTDNSKSPQTIVYTQ